MGDFKVIIIGGGLAGSLLANGLLNNGVNFRLYERDTRDSKREGYQIRLGDSAIKGFSACLEDEQHRAILRKFGQSSSASSTAPSLFTSQFKKILDLTNLPTYSKSSAINREVLRSLLVRPIDAAGHVQYGANFTYYEVIKEGECERVRAHFADGSSDDGDILVGADGSGSKVNENVGLRNIVPLNTHWSFLGKGSLGYHRLQKLPAQLWKGPIIVFSKGASLFYALYLPAKQGMDADSASSLAYDESEASFYWGLNIPRASVTKYENYSEIEDRRQFCLDYIKDWAPEFHTMLSTGSEDVDSPEVYVAPLRASKKPSNTWRREIQQNQPGNQEKGHPRVWLLGDAIHAMQPNRGMGGNQAMHDCAEILPHLLELNNIAKSGKLPSTQQVESACTSYEQGMIERAFAWVKKSGGHSVLTINLDGILGHVVWLLGKILVPLVSLMYKVLGN